MIRIWFDVLGLRDLKPSGSDLFDWVADGCTKLSTVGYGLLPGLPEETSFHHDLESSKSKRVCGHVTAKYKYRNIRMQD